MSKSTGIGFLLNPELPALSQLPLSLCPLVFVFVLLRLALLLKVLLLSVDILSLCRRDEDDDDGPPANPFDGGGEGGSIYLVGERGVGERGVGERGIAGKGKNGDAGLVTDGDPGSLLCLFFDRDPK